MPSWLHSNTDAALTGRNYPLYRSAVLSNTERHQHSWDRLQWPKGDGWFGQKKEYDLSGSWRGQESMRVHLDGMMVIFYERRCSAQRSIYWRHSTDGSTERYLWFEIFENWLNWWQFMRNAHSPFILCGKQVKRESASICALHIYRIVTCPGLGICGAHGPLEQELFFDFLPDILDQFNSIV